MEDILTYYQKLKSAIDNELYDDAGQYMTQLDQSIRQYFASPPQITESEQDKLVEISEFLSQSYDKMVSSRNDIGSELKSLSKGKQMRKAYGKL